MAQGDAQVRQVAWQDLGDDGRREKSIRQSYSGRYPTELLQNGHDACADAGRVGSVRFVLTETALIVANEGVGFEPSRITALTRLGSTSKATGRARHHQIGYKGIGFTSAFEVTDTPQIISNPAAFYFDRAQARKDVIAKLGSPPERREPVPARCFPFHLDGADWAIDAVEIERLRAEGAVTVIRLPLRHDRLRQQVEDDLGASLRPELLLFMPAVATLEVRSATRHETWTRHYGQTIGRGRLVHLVSTSGERRSWLTIAGKATVPTEETAALMDDLWRGVRRLNAAIAIPWAGGKPLIDPPAQLLHAYFPTDDRLGRALIVHGDFYLDDSRRHVESRNAPGAISGRVADAVARLTAELAESVAEQGHRLLACLAPIGPADGFGEEVGKRIDERLRQARIARPANGDRARRPRDIVRFGSGLGTAWERQAVTAVTGTSSVLWPGDDIGPAGALLTELGCKPMPPAELATRLDLTRSGLPYGQALALVERWLATLGQTPLQAAVTALRGRSVVQDRSGKWRRPAEVEERAPGAPELPPKLRRPELMQPSSPIARAFVRRMRVATLDAGTALDRMLDALLSGKSGATDSDKEQVLNFVLGLWRDHKGVFLARASRLGLIPVPARTFHGKRRGWRRADATYFSAPWSGTRVIEELYGPLGLAEFLGVDPPGDSSRAGVRELFATLGVAPSPRLFPVEKSRCSQFENWRAVSSVAEAHRCVENRHGYSGVLIDGTVVDRLDDLLALARSPERALALAHGLLLLDQPYGPEVLIRCANTEHRGHAMARRAIGYQRWRLEIVAWVPVRGDPSGIEVQTPDRAWIDIPRTNDWLVVPRAQLRSEDGRRLGLVRAEQPRPDSVIAALIALQDAHPELAAAPALVVDSAKWLMARLERILRRVDQPSGSIPPFPSEVNGTFSWSRSPLIANVPGLPRLTGVALLPPGRWTNLARTFGLRRASDSVAAEVQAGPIRHVDKVLSATRRAQLLALLLSGDASDSQTAARIAGIREVGVSFLNVRWSIDGVAADTVEATTHLAPRRDRRGHPIGAVLYQDARRERDPFLIGRALAEYVNLPDLEDAIVLFLKDPDEMVRRRGISPSDVEEAFAMLRRRRAFEPEPEPELLPPSLHLPSSAALEPSSPRSEVASNDGAVRSADSERLLDPSKVVFGTPLESMAPRALPRRTVGSRGADGRKSKEPEMISPGIVAVPDQEAEQRAAKIVTRFGYEERGAVEVRDVQSENKGWDLEFHFADGSWEPVEVKGSLGHGPFVITPNEWSAAQRHRNFVLYQVVGIANPATARMRCFRGLGDRLGPSNVKSMSWMVTGWSELDPEEIPLQGLQL